MNDIEIRKTFDVIKNDGSPIEVRIISGKSTFSGYFKDVDNLIKQVSSFEKAPTANIYFVLNKVKDFCYDREQCEKFIQNPKSTTVDNDIETREWILIDIDPTRASGISSSDDEKNNAKIVATAVYNYLKDVGFSAPITCDSGNGWHLLYKVKLENNETNKELVKQFLASLDMMFSDENASIDTSVFNASRITKLYGTLAKKGNNSKKRPHRESKILKIPDQIFPTKKTLIQKVASCIPSLEENTYKNNYGKTSFDIDDFIRKNNIEVTKIVNYGSGRKYILKECVFDSNHKAPDACIFVLNNGAIGYKCFHNSCQNYTWKDVRKKFEPNAYEFSSIRSFKPQGKTVSDLISKSKASNKSDKPFISISEIQDEDRSSIITIPSGFSNLDRRIIGFNKGEISLWSGKNGSAKSTVLTQICLNACDMGFKCAIFSGELTKKRLKQWIQIQAAGRQNVMPTKYENLYYVTKQVGDKIDNWLNGKLWVYDNDFGNKFEVILECLKDLCSREKVDTIVLDNLMAMDILTLSGDKYQQQTIMILALTEFVKQFNVHLHIVCHPRKSVSFLRKDDISGTADLTNAVDNVFIVHRVGDDFERTAKEFYGDKKAADYSRYGNVIEVCKNRDLGIMDELFGYYFEIPSKRFLVEQYENVCYGWEDPPTKVYREPIEDDVFTDDLIDDGELPF